MDRHSQPISTWWAEWKVWCSHHLVNILKSCWFFYFMPNNSFPRISSRCVLIRWGKAGTGLAQLCRLALTPLGIGPDQRFLTIFSDSMVIHNFYVLSTSHMNKTFSAVLIRLWRWVFFSWRCDGDISLLHDGAIIFAQSLGPITLQCFETVNHRDYFRWLSTIGLTMQC